MLYERGIGHIGGPGVPSVYEGRAALFVPLNANPKTFSPTEKKRRLHTAGHSAPGQPDQVWGVTLGSCSTATDKTSRGELVDSKSDSSLQSAHTKHSEYDKLSVSCCLSQTIFTQVVQCKQRNGQWEVCGWANMNDAFATFGLWSRTSHCELALLTRIASGPRSSLLSKTLPRLPESLNQTKV